MVNCRESTPSGHIQSGNIPVAGHFEPGKRERQDVAICSPQALREPLANAICRRDYTITGAAIFVAIFDDRLEVTRMGPMSP
jgi:ATP-dependent DNA helicase RecG